MAFLPGVHFIDSVIYITILDIIDLCLFADIKAYYLSMRYTMV